MESSTENFGKIYKNTEKMSARAMEELYRLIAMDKKGEIREVEVHMYRSFATDGKKQYYYCKTVKIEVKIPSNVQMIQCVREHNMYWLHMSKSSNYTFSLREYQRDMFKPFISQRDFDIIRGKSKCYCNFCPFPEINH